MPAGDRKNKLDLQVVAVLQDHPFTLAAEGPLPEGWTRHFPDAAAQDKPDALGLHIPLQDGGGTGIKLLRQHLGKPLHHGYLNTARKKIPRNNVLPLIALTAGGIMAAWSEMVHQQGYLCRQ